MSAHDSIRAIFFEECEDLLEALSDGLAALADGGAEAETVNAVFRSVHSIKGGAGAFGLDDVIGFAHAYETVLDRVRGEDLALDGDLLRLLQRSGDVLADLVEAARDGTGPDEGVVASTAEALEAFMGECGSVDAEFTFEAVAADLDFAPVDDPAPAAPASVTYAITFAPTRDLYATGSEPLVLLRALEDLGDVAVVADRSRLPDLVSFDWEESYLAWRITMVSDRPEAAIREVFEFVDGLCALSIEVEASAATDHVLPDLSDLAGSEPAVVAGAPVASALPTGPAGALRTDPPVASAADATATSPRRAKEDDLPVAQVDRKKEPRATLRVDVDRIDRLINAAGELIINQAMITQRARELGVSLGPEFVTDLEDYKQLARDIQEGVMGLRTQPIKQLFQRMTRIARESAEVAGKSARLVIAGEETEVDKKVIERLADPLTHMIRNAIDHGLETPSDRREANKPEEGTVNLTASYKSGNVLIQITDDGAGLNRTKIRQIAADRGLIPEDAELSDGEIDNLLFRPGFSTASSVTSLSGRGVGMDVVKTAIIALGGRITIASVPGEGSVFSILLPLTLAVLDGMVVHVGTETMILPISCIEEAIRPRAPDLSRMGNGQLLFASRGDYVPVIDLASRLGQVPQGTEVTEQTLLLIRSNGARTALAVDRVVDKRQVVIKSIAKNYRHVPGISAATILGDGKVALIVDPDAISEETVRPVGPRPGLNSVIEEAGDAA